MSTAFDYKGKHAYTTDPIKDSMVSLLFLFERKGHKLPITLGQLL